MKRILLGVLLVVMVASVAFGQSIVYRNLYTGNGPTGTNTVNSTQKFNSVGLDTIVYVITSGDTLAANLYFCALGNYRDTPPEVVSTAVGTGTFNRTSDTTWAVAYPMPINVLAFPRGFLRITGTSGNATVWNGTLRVDAYLHYKGTQYKTSSKPQ